jgi:hypothetical protein
MGLQPRPVAEMALRQRCRAVWLDPMGPRWLTITLLTFALVGVAAQVRALEATPLEITLDPSRFTGQMLTVHGTLTNLQPQRRMGGPGAMFDVMERGAFVHVLSLTPPPCSSGSAITVSGQFLTTLSSGGQTLTNVIAATSMSCP